MRRHLEKLRWAYFVSFGVHMPVYFVADDTLFGTCFVSISNPTTIQPFGAMLGFSVLDDLLPGVWPVSGVVATALTCTPFLRQAISWLGARKASMAAILQMFDDGFQVHMKTRQGCVVMEVERSLDQTL